MKHYELVQTHDYALRGRYEMTMKDEQGQALTSGKMHLINTAWGDGFVKTLAFSGVATPLHLRRHGYVRELFQEALDWGIAQGAIVSVLHPFSFSYYQKFGYGKVSDHLIVRTPIRMLDFVPRCCNLVKMDSTDEGWQEVYKVHNKFCQNRTLMMLRDDPIFYGKRTVYLYYENGEPTGYIAYSTEKTLHINHYEDGVMYVNEIAYLTPQALNALLGFIRMFEGELDDVEFANLTMCPEIDLLLRHNTHTRYRLLPDLMVRVLDTEKLFLSHKYPKQPGSFRIHVTDPLPTAGGSFCVEYGNDKVNVTRLQEDAQVDLTVDASTFARLVYGYDTLTPQQAAYMPGLSITGNADDFFRAFPKQNAGMFAHF